MQTKWNLKSPRIKFEFEITYIYNICYCSFAAYSFLPSTNYSDVQILFLALYYGNNCD